MCSSPEVTDRGRKSQRPGVLLALLTLALSTTACPEKAPEPPAFKSYAEAVRHYEQARELFPKAGPPPALRAMTPPDDEEGNGNGEGDQEAPPDQADADDQGPDEIPKPGGVKPWGGRWVGKSKNHAGVPEGGRGECPCELDFFSKYASMYFNGDPRNPNPPNPDPDNGLFPGIWGPCLARVPEPNPAGPPARPCADDCAWVGTRVEDWSLFQYPNGVFRLNCWKLNVWHCELGPPPGDIS